MAEIAIVRGDTLRLVVSDIKMSDGTDYVLADTDVLYLDIKKYADSKNPVIRKSATNADYVDNCIQFVFYPADTANLPIGEYYFDARLFMDGDNIYTIIPQSKFRIVQNITDIPDNGGGG